MFHLYKTTDGIIIQSKQKCYWAYTEDWDQLINRDDLNDYLLHWVLNSFPIGGLEVLNKHRILAPIGSQEMWAAGVTYLRSKTARMEESKESGAASFYDKVYDADRPELFYKANGAKVIGHNGKVRIRKDSTWNVPEPELTLVITSSSKIIGYSIGNDMSSRSIEGENPLYLPQAKMYDGSAALGPCVVVTNKPLSPTTAIKMTIERNNEIVFTGSTSIGQMKRTHQELVKYLFLENSFANGAYLMTGTCVVPENDFTLQQNDKVIISIDEIGTLVNTVA